MIELLVRELLRDGMIHVRVAADRAVTEAQVLEFVPVGVRPWAEVQVTATGALNLFFGDVRYPCREVVRCQVSCVTFRRLAVWKFLPGERVSVVVGQLAEWYFVSAHQKPGYAFMRKLPAGAVSGETEVDGVMLFEAEWALEGCVMVGG